MSDVLRNLGRVIAFSVVVSGVATSSAVAQSPTPTPKLTPSPTLRPKATASATPTPKSAATPSPATSTPLKPTPTPQPTDAQAETIAEFMKRVNAYVAIHQEAENALPKLSDEATPKEIDLKQRGLATRIHNARANAKRGDIFTPEMTAFVKGVLKRVFAGPDRAQLRSSIMDENVKYLPVKVNQRYPDTIPRATMPPDVLKALPELPEEMEYRFVGNQLILLDQHAHIIPDFIPAALPGK